MDNTEAKAKTLWDSGKEYARFGIKLDKPTPGEPATDEWRLTKWPNGQAVELHFVNGVYNGEFHTPAKEGGAQ